MFARSPASNDVVRRLSSSTGEGPSRGIVLIAWGLATALGYECGYINVAYFVPWGEISMGDAGGALETAIAGASEGVFIGLAQSLILIYVFGGVRWFLFLPLSAAALAAASLVLYLAGWREWQDNWTGGEWIRTGPFIATAIPGLFLGVAQMVLFERFFQQRRWLLWPVACVFGWFIGMLSWKGLENLTDSSLGPESELLLVGPLIGLVTGVAMAVLSADYLKSHAGGKRRYSRSLPLAR